MCCGSSVRTAGRRSSATRKSSKKAKVSKAAKKAPVKPSEFQKHLATLKHPQPKGAYYNRTDVKEDVSSK